MGSSSTSGTDAKVKIPGRWFSIRHWVRWAAARKPVHGSPAARSAKGAGPAAELVVVWWAVAGRSRTHCSDTGGGAVGEVYGNFMGLAWMISIPGVGSKRGEVEECRGTYCRFRHGLRRRGFIKEAALLMNMEESVGATGRNSRRCTHPAIRSRREKARVCRYRTSPRTPPT